ncbi:L-2-amino-thiazoline-4-carboxylic acid hydrolase [candidate division CSSED10-310 bacterium]|uniref:L-2-amino-thiazoline-4-carboxylic acid hydrolase n=1 Tax=candidate division CSSED10-310 bacterium TaxID=2855610 RepID=A0ABV6Z6Q9_UNCC1
MKSAKSVVKSFFFINQHAKLCSDVPSQFHVAIGSLILGSYRVLSPRITNNETLISILEASLVEAYRKQIAPIFKLGLKLTANPYGLLTMMSSSQFIDRHIWGEGYSFRREQEGGTFNLIVTRCSYHHFFGLNGHPELTAIICATDNAWMDEIQPQVPAVRVERPSLLSSGDDRCIFRFSRIERSVSH